MLVHIISAIKHGLKMLRRIEVVESREDFSPSESCVLEGYGWAELLPKNLQPVKGRPRAGLEAGRPSRDNPLTSAPAWPWSWVRRWGRCFTLSAKQTM